jgi:putative drug exporter of the RND superfamily
LLGSYHDHGKRPARQQVGFAVAAGIALAAFVMAMFFSPSLTALVGSRAWWPGGQSRTG